MSFLIDLRTMTSLDRQARAVAAIDKPASETAILLPRNLRPRWGGDCARPERTLLISRTYTPDEALIAGGTSCRRNDEASAISGSRHGAFRPPYLNLSEPFSELLSEVPVSAVLFRSKLLGQARASEERYAYLLTFLKTPTSPNQPEIHVKRAGSIGEGRYHSAFDGNLVAVDFVVERLAQRNDVVKVIAVEFCGFLAVVPGREMSESSPTPSSAC